MNIQIRSTTPHINIREEFKQYDHPPSYIVNLEMDYITSNAIEWLKTTKVQLEMLVMRDQEERNLREKNEAVKLAYEHYQTIVQLAKDHKDPV